MHGKEICLSLLMVYLQKDAQYRIDDFRCGHNITNTAVYVLTKEMQNRKDRFARKFRAGDKQDQMIYKCANVGLDILPIYKENTNIHLSKQLFFLLSF